MRAIPFDLHLGEGGHVWETVRLADRVFFWAVFGDGEAPIAEIVIPRERLDPATTPHDPRSRPAERERAV